MCSAHRLTVLYIGEKFLKISQMVSELWSGHEVMKHGQRDVPTDGHLLGITV